MFVVDREARKAEHRCPPKRPASGLHPDNAEPGQKSRHRIHFSVKTRSSLGGNSDKMIGCHMATKERIPSWTKRLDT